MAGWIGVDFDGVLSHDDRTRPIDELGPPIAPIVANVKCWLAAGQEVRVFTARVAATGEWVQESGRWDSAEFAEAQRALITAWCIEHIGQALPVTAVKDYAMIQMWDDRCVQIIRNKGIPARTLPDGCKRPGNG